MTMTSQTFEVPAVVVTGNATALLWDGQDTTIDLGAGTVEAHA